MDFRSKFSAPLARYALTNLGVPFPIKSMRERLGGMGIVYRCFIDPLNPRGNLFLMKRRTRIELLAAPKGLYEVKIYFYSEEDLIAYIMMT